MSKIISFEYLYANDNSPSITFKKLHALDLDYVLSIDYCPDTNVLLVEYIADKVTRKFRGIDMDTWEKILDAYLEKDRILGCIDENGMNIFNNEYN